MGTASKSARPKIFAALVMNLEFGKVCHWFRREYASTTHTAVVARGNRLREYPVQSRNSFPLECPLSQKNPPTPSAVDQAQSAGRHQFAARPLSAPYTLKRNATSGRLDQPYSSRFI